MKYLELIKENNEELKERYELVAERVAELAQDASDAGKYADYFEKVSKTTDFYALCVNSPQKCGLELTKSVQKI